jgi:hypothetical protein
MAPEVVVTADPRAADEDLRRRRDSMLGLEGVGFGARRQVPILDRISRALQQVLGLEAVGADMAGHDHAMEDGPLGVGGGCSIRHFTDP